MEESLDEMEVRLFKLKVRELKEMAEERNLDISKCKVKKDYVACIMEHERTSMEELIGEEDLIALEEAAENNDETRTETGAGDLASGDTDGPEEEMSDIDMVLESAKDGDVELTPVRDRLLQLELILDKEGQTALLAQIEDAMGQGEIKFRKFQSIGLSLAIISSQRYIDSIRTLGIQVRDPETLLREAKRNFADGMYDDAGLIVTRIRDIATSLHQEHRNRLGDRLKALEASIAAIKEFGADVDDAEAALIEARKAMESDVLVDCETSMDMADSLLDESRLKRIDLIEETIKFVRTLVEDAQSIGADARSASSLLDEASSLFEHENFQECMRKTIEAEEEVTAQIRQQAQKAQAILKSLEDRYRTASESGARGRRGASAESLGVVEGGEPCPTCSKPLSFIKKYDRWYCFSCKHYV